LAIAKIHVYNDFPTFSVNVFDLSGFGGVHNTYFVHAIFWGFVNKKNAERGSPNAPGTDKMACKKIFLLPDSQCITNSAGGGAPRGIFFFLIFFAFLFAFLHSCFYVYY